MTDTSSTRIVGGTMRAIWVPAILSAGVAVLTVVGTTFGDEALDARITTALVFMVVVVGLYSFVGNSGIVSFGHIAFMAIGGYSFALMTVPPELKAALLPELPGVIQRLDVATLPATLLAGLVSVLFAAVIGWPLMRLPALAASIAMFAVLNVVFVVNSQAYEITRGHQSLVGIPVTTTTYAALAWTIAAISAAYAFQRSKLGLRLRCAREDEFAAQAIGISIVWERVVAFLVSAFLIGIGGALFGALLGSLTPNTFYIALTFTTLVMLVVGGMYCLTGAVVGTALVFTVRELFRRAEEGFTIGPVDVGARPGVQLVGVSVLGLAILLSRPKGVTGGKEIPIPDRFTPRKFGNRWRRSGSADRALRKRVESEES